MSREIKFRVWHIEDREMFQAAGLNFDTKEVEQPIERDMLSLSYAEDEVMQPECVVMQYTGLKDRNGKEIYEGDILEKIEGRGTDGELVKSRRVVEFRSGKFTITADVEEMEYEEHGWGEGQPYSTVIGNVWENPELLPEAA